MGIHDLVYFHKNSTSNIVNKIVRAENLLYFASRSYLEGCRLLEYLNAPVVDHPSRIFKLTTSGDFTNKRNLLDSKFENALLTKVSDDMKDACKEMFKVIDKLMGMKLESFVSARVDFEMTAPTTSCMDAAFC